MGVSDAQSEIKLETRWKQESSYSIRGEENEIGERVAMKHIPTLT